MSLQDILHEIDNSGEAILLCDQERDWLAGDLLRSLSERRLRTPAHLQRGMYIAEINAGGYLGAVMYRIKPGA